MYAKLGHGRRAGAQAPPLPPPPLPQSLLREEAGVEEEEADEVSLNFYDFLEELDAVQEGEVPPADLQAAITASFESRSIRSVVSPGQPSGSRWLLGTLRPAQRHCYTRRWWRSAGRLSPIASRGVVCSGQHVEGGDGQQSWAV
jgi:hypothetical protein